MAAGCAEGKIDQAAAPAPDTHVVAVVNGEKISKDVWELWVKTRTRGGSATDLTPEQTNENLDSLVEMYLAAQQAEKDGLAKGEDGARIQLMQQSALADLAGRKFLEGKEPTPEEMKAEYDKQVATLPKTEYRARHILVDNEAKARELIAALDGGARFETLAQENSSDSSAQEGGDLGWFAAARMVKPFADAVEKLEKGAYTKEPVQSEFGWHVIRAVPDNAGRRARNTPCVRWGRVVTDTLPEIASGNVTSRGVPTVGGPPVRATTSVALRYGPWPVRRARNPPCAR